MSNCCYCARPATKRCTIHHRATCELHHDYHLLLWQRACDIVDVTRSWWQQDWMLILQRFGIGLVIVTALAVAYAHWRPL